MIDSLLNYSFMQHALLGAILASIACGIIGTIITEKRLVMMSGGIAHTAFGGVGLGYYLHIEPILGALIVAVSAALGIAAIQRHAQTQTDILVAMVWSVGMSLGIILISLMPGYPPDMTSYLFGDILTVSRLDLTVMLFLNTVIIFSIVAFYSVLKSYIFDEEFATLSGLHTRFIEYMLYILIALTIVIVIRVVGIILIITLLSTPPAIAKQFSHNFTKNIFIAIGLGIFFCVTGLWISYSLQLPSGPCIILLAAMSYFVTIAAKKWHSLHHIPSPTSKVNPSCNS